MKKKKKKHECLASIISEGIGYEVPPSEFDIPVRTGVTVRNTSDEDVIVFVLGKSELIHD